MKQLENQLKKAERLVRTLGGITKKLQDESKARDPATLSDQELLELSQNKELREQRVKRYLIPIEGWQDKHAKIITRFNKVLERVAHQLLTGGVNASATQRLWAQYSKERYTFALRWDAIPPSTWTLLWNVFSAETDANPNRMAHVHMLGRDMKTANIPFTDDQQLLIVEAMFIDGWRADALQNFRRLAGTLGANPATYIKYWQLGLRMYCQEWDFERAEAIVNRLIEAPYEKDHRVLMTFIKACAADPTKVEQGFEAYRKMRELLGDTMTKVDYDHVVSFFLVPNQAEYALVVFVDMMTSGKIDLRQRQTLPLSVTNPFFIGKWLKRLIGGGELVNAHNVLLHMMKKGIVARPIQVNALIGSLLRSQTADNVQRAEDIGWGMVNARIQFVRMRRKMAGLDPHITLHPLSQGWPNATLETFQLLAEDYKNRALHKKMEELWEAFRDAELAPDVFMMNQLLSSYLYDGKGRYVFDLFADMSQRYSIKPDRYTFITLWQSLPVNRMWTVPPESLAQEVKHCRSLFADIVRSAHVFDEEGGGIDGQFAGKILHAFRKIGDQAGLLAALRALRYVFRSPPPESVIMELLVGTTNLQKAMSHRDFMLHLKHLERFLQHRRWERKEAGEAVEDLDPKAFRRDEVCNFLELHIENEAQKAPGLYSQGWDRALEQAVAQMGLSDLS